MKNQLILFTADFPYGTGETFLETEIVYLAKGFDEVKIISQNISSEECRSLPDNCSVERINLSISAADKIRALFGVLNPLFWKERKVIKSVYGKHLTKGIIFTMLISLYRATKVKAAVSRLQQTDQSAVKQYFYSYWCDDVALGLAMAQKDNSTIVCFSRMHGWDVYFEASKISYLPYRHFISDNLKAIFAISQKGIDYALGTWKASKRDVFRLARLGVVQQKMGELKTDNFVLVSCSNVIPLKRVDLIVRALSEIKDQPLTWVHFGDGPQLEEVKALAHEILPSNITVDFKGRVPNHEILTWYEENNPSLFINVSTTEGIPVSIMEAMSFGIPVIATDVGGTSEIVNNENGILLAVNSGIDEIVNGIVKFIPISAAEISLKSQIALKTFQENFNAEINYKDFYKNIQLLEK
jgi:glycosyltransferase involved in cell wall biosynthesis